MWPSLPLRSARVLHEAKLGAGFKCVASHVSGRGGVSGAGGPAATVVSRPFDLRHLPHAPPR